MTTKLFWVAGMILVLWSCAQEEKKEEIVQRPGIPTEKPEIFLEGIVSVDSTSESMLSITNDGMGVYFNRYYRDADGKINEASSLCTRWIGNQWTDLKPIDRGMFYKIPRFVNDSLAITESRGCIWKSTRVNDTLWTKPQFMDSLDLSGRNGVTDWTVTADTTIYFVQNGAIMMPES